MSLGSDHPNRYQARPVEVQAFELTASMIEVTRHLMAMPVLDLMPDWMDGKIIGLSSVDADDPELQLVTDEGYRYVGADDFIVLDSENKLHAYGPEAFAYLYRKV